MKFLYLARTVALAGLAALSSSVAIGQETPNSALTVGNVGSGLSAERRAALDETARIIADNARNYANSAVALRVTEVGANLARRADDIADATLSANRDKVLRFIGLDPASQSSIYFFVSYEMPLEVLRAYVVEAMWSGGTLVFRGIPRGRTMQEFITVDLRALIYGKGASASLSIDPRLFEGYGVTTVPTIVYTEERKNFMCAGVNPKSFQYENSTHTYDTCPAVDDSKYWKITGAVTTDFALREFIGAGATGAQKHLDALARGLATGTVAPKAQVAFSGEWKDAITPEEQMSIKSAIETARLAAPGARPLLPEALAPLSK